MVSKCTVRQRNGRYRHHSNSYSNRSKPQNVIESQHKKLYIFYVLLYYYGTVRYGTVQYYTIHKCDKDISVAYSFFSNKQNRMIKKKNKKR